MIARAAAVLLLLPVLATADVGSVTEFSGSPAEAVRHRENMPVELGFSVQMLDQLITANSRMAITFEDDTRVELTEQSRLTIDDFVYDPATNTGQMAMNVMSGTVQMASGRIAQNNRANVNVRTPTATIAIRGTNFSMTVDELGRSLIVLLPDCDDDRIEDEDCPIGSIEVSTDAGSVMLTEAYESTLVSESGLMPSSPRRLLLGRADINNMLIISPPRQYARGFAGSDLEESAADHLSEQLLEFEGLTEDFFKEDQLEFSRLDIDQLGGGFLENLLMSAGLENELDVSTGPLPNAKNYDWVVSGTSEIAIFVRSPRPPHIAEVSTDVDAQGRLRVVQDGVEADLQLNSGGTDVVINITQTQ